MEFSKAKTSIIQANYSTMKFVSLIALGFAIFFLITDFLVQNVWKQEYVHLYRILDVFFAIISIWASSSFWLFKTTSLNQQKAVSTIFPFLVLIWSAIVTGIDFQIFGLTTFIIVLLLCAFFLYMDMLSSMVFIFTSCFVLLSTIYLNGKPDTNLLSLIFLLFPILIFSVLMATRNYKSKLNDISNQQMIVEMNKGLLFANENLENEVENRTKEIQIALEKAEESDQLKTAFLQNMSHEVRTPLNAISGFANLIIKPNQSPEKLKMFSEFISISTDKLIGIITDVVEISKIQSKQMVVNNSGFDIVLTINESVENFKILAHQKNIGLIFKTNISAEEYLIFSDREKIEEILAHLLENAIKFTEKGFVEISCKLIDTFQQKTLQIDVTDTGIGVSPEMQAIIFEPFRQVETGITRNFGGNGLGLSLIKAYTEILNGSVSLKSELNKGTTITVLIPAIHSEIPNTTEEINNEKFAVRNILIVEDEYVNYQYLAELLDGSGLKILYAENGQKAIDICRSDLSVDLVLMDIKMPVMDGHTATKLIKAFRPGLPIIAQTAYALDSEKEIFKLVFDDYITKPIDEDILKLKLNKYI